MKDLWKSITQNDYDKIIKIMKEAKVEITEEIIVSDFTGFIITKINQSPYLGKRTNIISGKIEYFILKAS